VKKNLREYAKFFGEYTELRVQENRRLSITLVNGDVVGNDQGSSGGVSARVRSGSGWGFSSHPGIDPDAVMRVIAAATANARFMAGRTGKTGNELPSLVGKSENDFSTTLPRWSRKEQIEFLRELDSFIVDNCHGISSRTLNLRCLDMEKNLLTSDGGESYSMVPRSICYVRLSAEKDGVTYDLFEPMGGMGQFEDVFRSPSSLFPRIEKLHGHLMEKASGVFPRTGRKECVLDADLSGVLSHEAVGHTVEADIVMGGSVAAGWLGKEVADPRITMVDFANHAFGALCPVPVFIDDEGTRSTDTTLIDHGVLRSFLHNRESAARFGVEPTGNARASEFSDEPLIRMRNTSIVPGTSKLSDMIASVDDGYYLMKFNNGQADSTSEFMFGITLGYEIKHGKLGRAIKDTTISGIAFEVLKTVTMVSDDLSWSCSGTCGKKQGIPVGLGGPALKCEVLIGGR